MRKLQKFMITALVALFGFSLVGPVASAKTLDATNLGAGNEVQLTKATKVYFVHIYQSKEGISSKVVNTKTIPKGSKLYGFYKGTEGVGACFYNFKSVKLTKTVWPSINLSTKNCKVVHKYGYKYSYEYSLKHILHEKD